MSESTQATSSPSAPTPSTSTPSVATQKGTGKKEGYTLAFDQAVDECKLSRREISDLWAEYQYMIDDRSGRPYNNIPVFLPRKYTTVRMVPIGGGKTKKEVTTFQEPDEFSVENCDTKFSRQRFYESRSFQTTLRQYYQNIGRDARFIVLGAGTKNARTLMKIY
jgi:hypothetical protein